jgi:DNA polymerase-3 subunit gamma/tau
MTQALYRRWRSQNFDEVVGQEHITHTLRNALRENRVAHAYLFSGPRGTGKTSTARILAKALNCTAPEAERPCNECPTCIAINEGRMLDLIEIDAASNNSVDDVRELRDKVSFRPSEGRYKVYIVDEVHMLSGAAFNALLKTLEEPPPHVRFILATTEPHKIPATVLSRCQRFDFRRIPAPEIAGHLRNIVDAEGFKAEDEALMAIARSAQGCMRDAVSLLDQMFSSGDETVTLRQVQQVLGAVGGQMVSELVDALAEQQIPNGLRVVQQLVLDGASLTEFTHQVVEYLRGVMVLQMAKDPQLLDDLPGEMVRQMQSQAQRMSLPVTIAAVKRFSEAAIQLKSSFQPQLPLELAFIEAVNGVAVPQMMMPAAMAATVVATGAATPTGAPVATTPVVTPTSASTATPPAKATAGNPTNTAAPVEAEAEPPPLDHTAIKKLRDQWKQVQAQVKSTLGYKVWAALNSVRDIAVSDRGVAFAFGTNAFAQQMISEQENHSRIVTILSDFLGRPVQLECQLGEQAKVARRISTNETLDANGADPLVEYAVNNLGAKVVDEAEQ